MFDFCSLNGTCHHDRWISRERPNDWDAVVIVQAPSSDPANSANRKTDDYELRLFFEIRAELLEATLKPILQRLQEEHAGKGLHVIIAKRHLKGARGLIPAAREFRFHAGL